MVAGYRRTPSVEESPCSEPGHAGGKTCGLHRKLADSPYVAVGSIPQSCVPNTGRMEAGLQETTGSRNGSCIPRTCQVVKAVSQKFDQRSGGLQPSGLQTRDLV